MRRMMKQRMRKTPDMGATTGRGPERYFLAFYNVICNECFSRGVGVGEFWTGNFCHG